LPPVPTTLARNLPILLVLLIPPANLPDGK
jgi:hypothetical protein